MRRSTGGPARRVWGLAAVLVVMLALGGQRPFKPGRSPLLRVPGAAAAQPGQSFRVIVVTADDSSVANTGGELQDSHGKKLGSVSRTFSVIHGAAADVTGTQLLSLAAQPGVVSVTVDAPVVQDAVEIPPQVWPASVGISGLPAAASAPAIAIVDSGVARGQAFAGRLVTNIDLTSPGNNGGQGDRYRHGTLVAGIAASSSTAYPGAAPSARLVSIRVVRSDGSALTSDVIAVADWIGYTNGAQYGIRVANFSLHSSAPASAVEDPLDRAVRRKRGPTQSSSPLRATAAPEECSTHRPSDPFVITVGAVGTGVTPEPRRRCRSSAWSSFGYTADGFAKPELVAPGRMHGLTPVPTDSTLALGFPDRVVAPGWMWMSGTSFAAPVVSGIAARLLSIHPNRTPDQVKGALMATATGLAGGPQQPESAKSTPPPPHRL